MAVGDRAPVGDRPWVMVNMVASIDGAAWVDGLSRGLSSRADKALFAALRDRADVILVGARTANAERYGPARRSGARIAVVSATLGFDHDLPLFAAPTDPPDGGSADRPDRGALPLVVTTCDADLAGLRSLEGRAELIRAGRGTVDLAVALRRLGESGARVVLCEGGPRLNAGLLAADLIDEINVTFAPLAVGTSAPRIIAPATAPPDSPAPDMDAFGTVTTGGDASAPTAPGSDARGSDTPALDTPSGPRGFLLGKVGSADGVLFVRWLRART